MSVFRVNKNSNYTIMSNYHFRDNRLSLKAKGLLSEMLSLPDDWDYSLAGLVSINKEETAAIKSALGELKDAGYVTITRLNPNETNSKKIEWVYDIYETPNKCVENQSVENQPIESQSVGNPLQLNTNKQSTKEIITKELNMDAFEAFWKAYPRKEARKAALKAFSKIDTSVYPLIVPSIEKQTKALEWTKDRKRFIPLPATWLNGNRWEDEVETKDIDPRAYDGAIWLSEKIAERVIDFKAPSRAELDRWASDIDQLHRSGYTWRKISDTALWALNDKFWSSVIVSGEALRKNFVKLLSKEAAECD